MRIVTETPTFMGMNPFHSGEINSELKTQVEVAICYPILDTTRIIYNDICDVMEGDDDPS